MTALHKFLWVILIVVCPGVFANSTDTVSPLHQIANDVVANEFVAGASIIRVAEGRVIEHFSVGQSQPGVPMHNDTVFQVGSISKPIAAWAVMTLVRDGKVDLDAPIDHYLSRWSLPESKFDRSAVTIRRVLSHTAGLSLHGYPGFPEDQPLPDLAASLNGETNGAGSVTLMATPGERFSYSGGGFTLLQLLVEEVTAMPFAKYVEQAVFEPLTMHSSSYSPGPELLARRAQPHGFRRNAVTHHHFRAEAAASLHSTTADMAKFLLANVSENPILTADLVTTMHDKVAGAGFADIGLGFFRFAGGNLIGHGGANQGWRADLVFDRAAGAGLVILTNAENGGELINALRCAWDDVYGAKVLQERCRSDAQSTVNYRRLFSGLAVLLVMMSLLIVGWRIRLLMSKRIVICFPRYSLRRAAFGVVVGFALFWSLFFYTSLGASIVSGMAWMFTTIHYAPSGFERLSLALLIFLFVLALSLITGTPANSIKPEIP